MKIDQTDSFAHELLRLHTISILLEGKIVCNVST
jgi:hypothetical protein